MTPQLTTVYVPCELCDSGAILLSRAPNIYVQPLTGYFLTPEEMETLLNKIKPFKEIAELLKDDALKHLTWQLDREIWAAVEAGKATTSWGREQSRILIDEYCKAKVNEAREQAIREAAEVARTRTNDECTSIIVDKQSILNLLNKQP